MNKRYIENKYIEKYGVPRGADLSPTQKITSPDRTKSLKAWFYVPKKLNLELTDFFIVNQKLTVMLDLLYVVQQT
jgi:hypothetical protein